MASPAVANTLQTAALKALPRMPYSLASKGLPLQVIGGTSGNRPYAVNGKERASVEAGNPLTPISVEDQKTWMDPDYTPQLLRHEMTHVLQNNWPRKILDALPPVNPRDPYNYGGVAGLKKIGGDPMKLSVEQQAAVEQEMQAMEQSGQRLDPIYQSFDRKLGAIPLSVMEPTDPNGKGINTTPRPPGLPAQPVAGMGRLYAAEVKPVPKGSGDVPETLPADFFDKQAARGDAPETLPADFFEKQDMEQSRPPVPPAPLPAGLQGPPSGQGSEIPTGLKGFEEGAKAGLKGLLTSLVAAPASSGNYPSAAYTGNAAADAANVEHGPAVTNANNALHALETAASRPAYSAGSVLAPLAVGGALGLALPEASAEMGAAGRALRTAARGNPEAAALRGMGVATTSPDSLRALNAYHGARPFLQGVGSLEELQARIPQAKEEIWSPYKAALEEIGTRPALGPSGMTTVEALESERKVLSALNRGLRNGDPQAVQLAQQKGLNQAELLAREEALKNALDPHLENVGIQPKAIRKAFGQVSGVERRVAGKSTLLENEPSGLGKMVKFGIGPQGVTFPHPFEGLRDIAAGRPWWSARPTDVNIGEAFRIGGEKPDFGAVLPQNRLKLPAQVPFREGEFPYGEWQYGVPAGSQVTPPPRIFPALPAIAGLGEAEPMIQILAPKPYPPLAEDFARERPVPTVFSKVDNPFNTPRGLLPAPKDLAKKAAKTRRTP